MKHTNLFTLAASMLLFVSCGNGGNNSSASAASSSVEASSSFSSRSRTRSWESSVSSSSSAPSEAALPDTLPAINGTNVIFVEGMRSGGESDARANPGYLYEWHGDGGNDASPFNRDFYFILNLAICGNYDSGLAPKEDSVEAEMNIDYVHCYLEA